MCPNLTSERWQAAMTDASLLLHAPRRLQQHVVALDIPRLLAAVHIVLYHTHEKSTCFVWGVTQVPFFLALTGFGLTHSYTREVSA